MPKRKIKKPPTSYTPAPAVAKMGSELINAFHEHLLKHQVRVEYIFRSDTPRSKGTRVLGTARKVTSLSAFFGRQEGEESIKPFFAIVISRPAWDDMDDDKRRALVDHELCHCGAEFDGDGNTKLTLLHHDLEEFTCIVERHGLWEPGVKRMGQAFNNLCPEQLSLLD